MAQMEIEVGPCVWCKKKSKITVPSEGLEMWRNGALIQQAFPTLDPDSRELLLTGTHGKCFDDIFPEEEEEN